jgi:hypothetical protein
MKMGERRFPNPVGLDQRVIRRHSGESQNPVFSAWVVGRQKNENKNSVAVLGGYREMGFSTPGFWLSPE